MGKYPFRPKKGRKGERNKRERPFGSELPEFEDWCSLEELRE